MFGVSNLSWNDDIEAKIILDKYNIKYIEVAPTKLCPWEELTSETLREYERKMGKKIISIQSVLYNTNLSITKKEDSVKIIEHLSKIIKICNEVDIPKIVFGSPKARIINTVEDRETFFENIKIINEVCSENNVYFCIENNSKHYGCNFMTTTTELLKVIEKINMSHIKMHIDTGNMFMENESTNNILETLKYLESFHISDKNLGKIETYAHKNIGNLLEYINYNKYITLETINHDLEQNIKKVFSFYSFKTRNICLIGHTGFVGSNLKEQMFFTDYYNSKNIHEIKDKHYDEIYCCGAPGRKWYANKYPDEDRDSINNLLTNIKEATCNNFILISTIDVYHANNLTEDSKIDINKLDAYGSHRFSLELLVKQIFPKCNIFRLGALFGKYLKKNIIYDLLNQNNVDRISRLTYFQWYNLANLLDDINIYKDTYSTINLFSKPVSSSKICAMFGYNNSIYKDMRTTCYNIKSKYHNQETEDFMLQQIKKYIYSQKKIYRVFLVNTKKLPIPHTHGLCCKKLLTGFMYNGCFVHEIKHTTEFNKINDNELNVFIYSDHYKNYGTRNEAMKIFNEIGNKFKRSWHICWYMTDMLKSGMPFKKFIMTGEKLDSPFEELNNEKKEIVTLYNKYNYVPMSFGIDINPYEDLKYNNKYEDCKYNYCFIGTPYKKNWTETLDKCLYFSHHYTGRYCVGQEKENFMKNSIVGLGFNAQPNVRNGVVTDRIYESLAYCKLCFTDSKAAVAETKGIAILVESEQDIKDKFEYYMNNKYEMYAKNKLGKLLLKEKGTYFHSAKNYINFLSKK